MFCCVFGWRLFFTNLLFFAIFFSFCQVSVSIMFSCVRHILGSFPNWPPSLFSGAFLFPLPAPSMFFLSVLVHVFRPRSGSDVVGPAGHCCCGLPVVPWDWQGLGQTVQELQRLGPPKSLHSQGIRPTIDCDGKVLHFFLIQHVVFLFVLPASFKKKSPIRRTCSLLLKFGQICSNGRKDGVLGETCNGS